MADELPKPSEHGYNRRGDGGGPFHCTCEWSYACHGDTCPEHGRPGVALPTPVEYAVAIERARCAAVARRLGAVNVALLIEEGGPA